MKVLFTLLTLAGFITASLGQETVKKTYKNESPPYKETFYVLKDDQEVKHGRYEKSYRGFSMKGQYENGKRAGIWEVTGQNGKLAQKIDFINNTVTNFETAGATVKCMIKDGDVFREVKPEEAAAFLGGKGWMATYVWTSLRYPADARRYGIQGEVLISATITKEGKMIDEKVEKGLGYGTDEEALRVIQLFPDDWIPAKVNGETVEVKVVIPVKFKLA